MESGRRKEDKRDDKMHCRLYIGGGFIGEKPLISRLVTKSVMVSWWKKKNLDFENDNGFLDNKAHHH